MYTSTYNTEEVQKNNRIMNIAHQRFIEEIRNTNTLDPFIFRNDYFTRAEKKHLAWLAKWAAIGFVVASVARYLINQL